MLEGWVGARITAWLLVSLAVAAAACAAPAPAAPLPSQDSPAEVGLRPGERAPAFEVATLEGGSLTSAQLLGEGKPFVLYFFATW